MGETSTSLRKEEATASQKQQGQLRRPSRSSVSCLPPRRKTSTLSYSGSLRARARARDTREETPAAPSASPARFKESAGTVAITAT